MNPNKRGKNKVIWGNIVIITRVRTKNTKKGNNGFTTDSIGILLMPQATKRQMPTGGVIIPMPTFAATKIPKWIGSIPSDTATGTKIGIKTIIAGKASMIIPSIRNTMWTRMINNIQLSAYVTINCAIACGILSKVKINENIEAVARTNSTTPDNEQVFNKTFGISSIDNSL